jgi:ABC-type amino acid transport substrate-binding protein
LIFGLIIWVFERKKNPHFEQGAPGLFSGLWFSAVTMTTVGYGDKAPVTTAGKITTLIWMFTALIIISGFTASIAASLTVGQLGSEVNSMADLRKLNIGTIEKSSSEGFLSKKQMNLQTFQSVQEGLKAVSSGQIEAFVYDEPLIRFRLQENNDYNNLQVLPFTFKRQYYSLGFPKHSIWLDQLNPKLISLIGSKNWQDKVKQYGLLE